VAYYYGVTSAISITLNAGVFTVLPDVNTCDVIVATLSSVVPLQSAINVAVPLTVTFIPVSAFLVILRPDVVPSAGPVKLPLVSPVFVFDRFYLWPKFD